MSGHVPDFIRKDHYVMHNGQKEVVEDYFHTSPRGGGPHNSDELVVVIGGKEIYFGDKGHDIAPVSPDFSVLPSHLRPGEVVLVTGGKLDIVREVYVMEGKGEWAPEVRVTLENNPFARGAEEVYPVPPSRAQESAQLIAQHEAAKKLREEKLKGIQEDLERMRRNINSSIFKRAAQDDGRAVAPPPPVQSKTVQRQRPARPALRTDGAVVLPPPKVKFRFKKKGPQNENK